MAFMQECEAFLEKLTRVRNEEIARAVQTALATDFAPVERQIRELTASIVAKETERKNALIAKIEADYALAVRTAQEDANAEIEKRKSEITDKAQREASAKLDQFILGVSKLADDIKI